MLFRQPPLYCGSPGRTRTCDQPVNSRLLYQLSYRGTKRFKIIVGILAKLKREGGDFFRCRNHQSRLRLMRRPYFLPPARQNVLPR